MRAAALVLAAAIVPATAQSAPAQQTGDTPPVSTCDARLKSIVTVPSSEMIASVRLAAECLLKTKEGAPVGQQFALAIAQERADATKTLNVILATQSASDAAKTAAGHLLAEFAIEPETLAREGMALLTKGDVAAGKARCDAAGKLKPGDQHVQDCLSAADRMTTARRASATLDIAAQHAASGRRDEAVKLVTDLLPTLADEQRQGALAILKQADDGLRRETDAVLDVADQYVASGRRDDAVALIKQELPKADPDQKKRAVQILKKADAVTWSMFGDRLRASWLLDLAFGLLMAVALFVALLLARRIRVAYVKTTLKRPRTWSLVPIVEDSAGQKLGAADVVLDAVRRIPQEVRRELWEPTSILFPPVVWAQFYAPVWEDFLVAAATPSCRIGEALPAMDVNQERLARDDFFAAFQNVQLTTGTTPVMPLVRLVKSAFDWFNAGAPAFSGVASVRTAGTKSVISVRLSASDPLNGAYMAVMASTEDAPDTDALALSAERAAYKLLYRLQDARRLQDSPKEMPTPLSEIEGRAALRQGIGLLASYARADNGTVDDRKTGLSKAATNLDFAVQTLRGDGARSPWPEVLRFKAVACFLTGDLTGAMQSLEQIQDTRCEYTPRSHTVTWLGREARHNQAVVLTRLGGIPNLRLAHSLFSACIADATAVGELDGLALSAHFGRVTTLAAVERADWPRLDVEAAGRHLIHTRTVFDEWSGKNTLRPTDRRVLDFMKVELGRAFGVAWARYLFAQRGEQRIATPSNATETRLTTVAREDLESWLRTHEATIVEHAASSYLLLIDAKYAEAFGCATVAMALDPKKENPRSEFVYYLAAESLLQQGSLDGAETQSAAWQGVVTEPVFRELRAEIARRKANAAPPIGAPALLSDPGH